MSDIEWVSDARGNKCSVAYFGSVEAEEEAAGTVQS